MKKFISLLLCVIFTLCLFTCVQGAEGVTVTQNGVNLDGMTDMPLSFTPTITFPQPVAEGTDLSSISVKSESGTLTPTVTEGTATDGYFTTATVAMPVLAGGTEYTLEIPAIGSNPAGRAVFKTVGNSYILKEDFNGGFSSDWYNSNAKETRIKSYNGVDSDGDSINDAMYFNVSKHATLAFGTAIPAGDITQLTVETRVKFSPKSGYLLGDNSVNAGNTTNGCLMRIQGNANNNTADVRTDSSTGVLTYGGNATNGANYNACTSDFKIYADTWYTIRITFSENEGKMQLFVTDDNGNAFSGAQTNTRWGSSYPVNPLDHIVYTYGTFVNSTVDYIYIWDNKNSNLGTAAINDENGAVFDGKENVSVKKALGINVNFPKGITEDELDKINVTGGAATADKVLSEDGKNVSLTVTGLEYSKKYFVSVSKTNLNTAVISSFTTEAMPTSFYYEKDGESIPIRDASSTPLNFELTYELSKAVGEDTDLSGITISSDGKVSAELNEDGTAVKIKVSNLKYLSRYTISMPEIGVNGADTYTFTTENGKYLFRADFDDNDLNNYSFVKSDYSTESTIKGGVDTETGLLTFTGGTDYYANLKFTEAIDFSGKNIAYESVVKFTKGRDTTRPESVISTKKTFYGIRGNNHNQSAKIAGVDGYLATGSDDNVSATSYTVSDYEFKADTNYKIRIEVKADSSAYKVYITDLDDPNAKTALINGESDFGFHYVYGLFLPYAWQYGAVVDYMHVVDADIERYPVSEPEFSSYKLVPGEEITAYSEYVDTELDDSTLILAFYDKNNQITRISTAQISSQNTGAIKEATVSMTPADGEILAKAFVWNSLSGMMPYSKSNTLASDAARDCKIYVSGEWGSDTTGDGSDVYPYLTVQKAVEKLKSCNNDSLYKNADMEIIFDDGSYNVSETVSLTESNVSNFNSVTFKALNETATLKGGVNVNGSAFSAVTDSETLSMFNTDVQGKIYALNLADYGVNLNYEDYTNPDNEPMRTTLYYNGESETMARYPNSSNLVADSATITATEVISGSWMGEITVVDSDLDTAHKSAWANLDISETWSKGWYFYDWEQLCGRLYSVTDSAVTVRAKSTRALNTVGYGSDYFIYNLPYEIDSEGEYAIYKNVLYYYPSESDVADGSFKTAEIQLSTSADDMFTVTADNVSFEKLAFENHGGYFINATGDGINIKGCEFFNGAADSVSVKGNNCSIKSCDFHDIGGLAVAVKGGDRNALTPSGTVVENCYFARTGQVSRTGASAISVSGCGVTVRKNTIHDTPHHAVRYSGNNHIIEYNNIYNCVTDGSGDAGIIYTGRDLSGIGTFVQYNYIHDTNSSLAAVYWDDCQSGQNLIGNVFENLKTAVFNSGGVCCTIENNIIAGTGEANSVEPHFKGIVLSSYWGGLYITVNNVNYNRWSSKELEEGVYNGYQNTFMANLQGCSQLSATYPGFDWQNDPWKSAYLNTDKSLPAYRRTLTYVNNKTDAKTSDAVVKDNYFAGYDQPAIVLNNQSASDLGVYENNTAGTLTGNRLTQYNSVVNNCGIYTDEYRTTTE